MEKTIRKIIGILDKDKHINAYALIGGLAVSGWVTPRATKDIDLMVDLDKADRRAIENGLLKILTDSGFQGSLKTGAPEDDIKFCLKVVSGEGVSVDIIFAGRKWESEIVRSGARARIFKGVILPVARPEGLILLKLKAGSFQDIADASKLLMEAEYDRQALLSLAKRARVDKKLARLMKSLGLN
ncbi:MAG: hypothetical protein HY266_03360 [Deltaproteobacteria bacterium]|nr:hypothetical protein [Deltaproteobacteria bacterium]